MKSTDLPIDWHAAATWSPKSFERLSQLADDLWIATEPGPRVLVVAHDAGGAELLAAWVRRRLTRAETGLAAPLQPTFLLEGPALKVFSRAGFIDDSSHPPFPSIDRTKVLRDLAQWDWVLTGTGWASDLERWAIHLARQQQLFVCSYLEHWINYQERFISREGGDTVLPNQIWLGDPWAEKLARTVFGNKTAIHLVPNPYFAQIRAAFESNLANLSDANITFPHIARSKVGQRLLYVTEPLSQAAQAQYGNARWYGYTEFEALEEFLTWLQVQSSNSPVEVLRLRPHPSEAREKYSTILCAHAGAWHLSPPGNTLLQDCLWAETIVGCNTMALVIGWLVDRRVLCSIPAHGPACILPLPGIERLFPPREKLKQNEQPV